MVHLRSLTTAALLMALAGAGAATSQPADAERRGQMTFETLDVDGSGEITADDLAAMRAERFEQADSDGDGRISRDEFMARAAAKAGERAERMFDRMDVDGDGFLSQDTLNAPRGGDRFERLLRRADSDSSGGIDAEEFAALRDRMSERHGQHGGGFHRERR